MSTICSISSHLIDDACDTQAPAVSIVDSIHCYLGCLTSSDTSCNTIPHYFATVVVVFDSTPLSCSELFCWFTATNPIFILIPKFMQCSWHWGKSAHKRNIVVSIILLAIVSFQVLLLILVPHLLLLVVLVSVYNTGWASQVVV